MLGEGGADGFYVRAVGAHSLMEELAGDAEFFGPVGDIGCHFGVDVMRVVGAFVVFVLNGSCGCEDVGHDVWFSCRSPLGGCSGGGEGCM